MNNDAVRLSVPGTRAFGQHSRRVAIRVGRGLHRHLRIGEILIQIAGPSHLERGQQIGILIAVCRQAGAAAAAQEELDGKAIVHSIDAVDLPTTKDARPASPAFRWRPNGN